MQDWAHHGPKQHMNNRCHFRADPKAVAGANRLRNDLGEPKGSVIGLSRIGRHVRSLQDDEDRADYDTLKATTENGVCNHRECLIDYHVRKEEGHEKEVAILPDRLDFLRIALLFTTRRDRAERSGGCRCSRQTRTHGVPLMLNTFNWVSSKLMYPKVNPANTPERMTRTGMRHPKMIFFVSESSSRFAKEWRPAYVTWVSEACTVVKREVGIEEKKRDKVAILATRRRPRPADTAITIR